MEITRHFFTRPDGTRLRAYDTGGTGPVVVLANGLGGPLCAFNGQLSALAQYYRVVSWDYRGLYGSLLPPEGDLSVRSHAEDLAALLDALAIRSCSFVGWSMGVQVGLELYRLSPERVDRLVLMNGTFGRPFQAIPFPASEQLLGGMIRGASKLHFLGGPLLSRVRHAKVGPSVLKRLGLIAEGFDETQLRLMLEDFETIDFSRYAHMLKCLSEHDAESLLPSVRVPTLVITGSRDRITPSYSARRIAEKIPGAELYVIVGATHYAAAEYPKEVLSRMLPFLAANVHPTATPGIQEPTSEVAPAAAPILAGAEG